MNRNLGLIGQKIGNTRIFEEDGTCLQVTAVQAGPCTVLGIRTPERHGYSALQLGYGERKDKHVTKPEAGFFKKHDLPTVRVIQEFRVTQEVAAKYEVGQTLSVTDLLEAGQFVDVTGTSKGAGFAGVIKRHNFSGAGTDGHGTHESTRHGGSIGQNMTPGRVFRGMKMPGQHGNRRVTTQNIRVAKVLAEENIVLLLGAVPGSRQGVVTVRTASKKRKAVEA